ncbi:3-beta hydroxysteroid dehydrogenase/isomerase family-domain-containing protein [Leucosporidium creatinivorum]|uniref:3-beta hydroxysteroid dehydrogenase/isomerase family-domain-containing protein n=1 Tax=Leucosporidium creatinivorum TaxID=106004 RepID=A0A1Y2DE89_9BASI|nr:3-beta hydroxysteroid dehydrogenase/isomerase family-domain-containing protein [Leucosporidium creatinivorum]
MASPTESFAVIGGEGFVGQALVQGLLSRYPQNPVASFGLTQRTFTSGYRFFRTDITSIDSLATSLKASGATTVFHTASPHAHATREVCEAVNVEGTKAVVQACREAGVTKLVFTSTMTTVFDGQPLINADERMPTTESKEVPYVWTKVEAERIVLEANGVEGLLTCALRLAGIIGPGDRQVVPGFMKVLHNGQTSFQIGNNDHLYDFVHVANVVHAHIIAASKLGAPPVPASTFETRLPLPNCTVPRRNLPTSLHPEQPFPPSTDSPIPSSRNRFQQFYEQTEPLGVAGEAFFITNGEPIAFWTFARALWNAYDGHVPRYCIKIPESAGMLLAECAEFAGWLRGVAKEDCGMPKAHVQYVLSDMYFDIEKARRVLGYEPVLSLSDGIKDAVAWYKEDEERQKKNQAGK